jgi:chromosomal replication initiator protein
MLHGQDKQIIVSSDRPPKSPDLEERPALWASFLGISSRPTETRLPFCVQSGATGRRYPIDLIGRTPRSVEHSGAGGALNRIIAFADLSGQSLTPELVEAALADLLPQRQTILPERIVELVAREWKTTSEALLGRDRSQRVAEPRQVAMYLMRKETDASLPQIGEVLGGRDHTTVMYAIHKIANQIETG